MKRLTFAVVMALLFFILLNFIYCNLDGQTFTYEVIFKFSVPHLISLQSVPIPMGFVLLLAFCGGMVAIAIIEALPSFFKTLEIRSKNKKIRQLERELSAVRQISERAVRKADEEVFKRGDELKF
ncbi:MAG: LapA family protein [Pseudomonadota bacterium]